MYWESKRKNCERATVWTCLPLPAGQLVNFAANTSLQGRDSVKARSFFLSLREAKCISGSVDEPRWGAYTRR